MINVERLQNDLIHDEGLKLDPYTDTLGNLTIGVGHLMSADGREKAEEVIGRKIGSGSITRAEALEILQSDIAEVVAELSKENFWPLVSQYEVRSRALVNMTFNLGLSKLFHFTNMIAALLKSDWEKAAAEMEHSLWAHEVGARALRLAEMMRSGEDADGHS